MSAPHLEFIQPAHFARPRGYANGALAREGQTLYVAGQIGCKPGEDDLQLLIDTDDFVDQFTQALANVLAVVEAAGGQPTDIADMTIYVTALDDYRHSAKALGSAWKSLMGRHYPAMALVGVAGLVHPRAKVEIQAVARWPETSPSDETAP